jgi:hypothetical protein
MVRKEIPDFDLIQFYSLVFAIKIIFIVFAYDPEYKGVFKSNL